MPPLHMRKKVIKDLERSDVSIGWVWNGIRMPFISTELRIEIRDVTKEQR